MACSLKTGLCISGSTETYSGPKIKGVLASCASFESLNLKESLVLGSRFLGRRMLVTDQKCSSDWNVKAPNNFSVHAQASICVSRALRWWDKTLQPNMIDIHSAQELVDSLLDAGDRLVIIDFYARGCGGCKTLHPKICQLAELNPDAIFLKVDFDELRTMCEALNIKVLPFFRFYRGAEGRVCSFSCTNATIKKFKDALTKHGAGECIGPAKGLDESELRRLAAVGEISMDLQFRSPEEEGMEDFAMKGGADMSGFWGKGGSNMGGLEEEMAMLKV